MKEPTRFEEQILLSIWKLQDDAYGVSIYEHIRNLTDRNLSVSGIYIPLERLVKKGYLDAYMGEPTQVRGGQRKRYYRLTHSGRKMLIRNRKTQERFWRELPGLSLTNGNIDE